MMKILTLSVRPLSIAMMLSALTFCDNIYATVSVSFRTLYGPMQQSINGSIPNSQPSNLIPIVTPRSSYTYLNFGCWNCEPLHNGIQQNIQVCVSFHHKQSLTPLNKVKRSGGMLYNSLLLCYLSMCSYVCSDSLPGGRKFLQHLHPSVKCFKASIAQTPPPLLRL